MTYQYIHTSSKRGLDPGKSGLCCVARSEAMPPDLLKELNRLSHYEHFSGGRNPVIMRHLILSERSGHYHALSRVQDAGIDYSKRNNHIAHHLVFEPEELDTLPDPISILLYWKGWRDAWNEPPRVLASNDRFELRDLDSSPSKPRRHLDLPPAVEGQTVISRVFDIDECTERDGLRHIRDGLMKLPVAERWAYPLTNFLLQTDRPLDYVWSINWKGRELPYEYSKQPRAIERKKTDSEPSIAQVQEEVEQATKAKSGGFFAAPRVEVPQDLRQLKRRRRKRPLTRRKVATGVNLCLLGVTLACAGFAAYFYKDVAQIFTAEARALPGGGPENSPPKTDSTFAEGSQKTLEERWETLLESGSVLRALDESSSLVNRLKAQGNDEPARQLALLQDATESSAFKPITVPKVWVQLQSGVGALSRKLVKNLPPEGVALVPAGLAYDLQRLEENHPGQSQRILENGQMRFDPEAASLAAKALRRKLRDDTLALGASARTAIKAYGSLAEEVAQSNTFKPLANLSDIFGSSKDEPFLFFDENGLLVTPAQLDLARYLRELFERFAMTNYAEFSPSEPYEQALRRMSEQRSPTALEVAQAIQLALSAARTEDPTLQGRLDAARARWGEAFSRQDPTETALLGYTLERLENAKRELAHQQANFSVEDLARFEAGEANEQLFEDMEVHLQQSISQEDWVVMRTQ